MVMEFLLAIEDPLYTLFLGFGCLYFLSLLFKVVNYQKSSENISFKMTVDRVDESLNIEQNSLTHKMKVKSKKIVMDAEKGEAKLAIDKCKKFLSSVESSNFKCKIFINSWEVFNLFE